MTSLSLRALCVFPCGACAALVSVDTGCEHMPPPASARKPRGTTLQETRNARFDREGLYALRRLARSSVMRGLLQRAILADGEPVAALAKADRHPANGLVRAGLLTLTKRGGDYMITDKGREVWRQILAL